MTSELVNCIFIWCNVCNLCSYINRACPRNIYVCVNTHIYTYICIYRNVVIMCRAYTYTRVHTHDDRFSKIIFLVHVMNVYIYINITWAHIFMHLNKYI